MALVLLFLYNPFFTIYGSSAKVTVKQPLSYRGTVASSELRRSVIPQAQPRVDVPRERILEIIEVQNSDSESADTEFAPKISSQSVFLEGLWFRPPPAL